METPALVLIIRTARANKHYVRLHRRRQPQLAATATRRPEEPAPRVRRRDHAPGPQLAPEPACWPAVDPRKQRLAARQHAGRCRRAGAGARAQRAPRARRLAERHAAGPLPPLQNNARKLKRANPRWTWATRRSAASPCCAFPERTRAAADRGGRWRVRAAVPSLSAARRVLPVGGAQRRGSRRAPRPRRRRPGNEETTGRPPAAARAGPRRRGGRRERRAFIRQAQQPASPCRSRAVVSGRAARGVHEPARSARTKDVSLLCRPTHPNPHRLSPVL